MLPQVQPSFIYALDEFNRHDFSKSPVVGRDGFGSAGVLPAAFAASGQHSR
ncbi:MAG: hypothetical protein ABSA96_15115 [Candidatus Acidiferrales bacterium]